jgi:ADP-ribose pyrophosphatase
MDKREKVISNHVVYRGRILNLRVDNVRVPSGKRAYREVIEHSPAVGILPVTTEGKVLLVSQFRYAIGEEMLEIPAGLVENDEPLEDAALRELQEEVGYTATVLKKIASFYTSPGFSNELLVLYLASGLKPSKLPEDEDEFIQVVAVDQEDIPVLLKEGKIQDGKTFAALSWFLAQKQ